MKRSLFEKRMLTLIQNMRGSVQNGIIVTERDAELKQEMLKVCDRLELKLNNYTDVFVKIDV